VVLVPVRASRPVPGALRVFLQLPDQGSLSRRATTLGEHLGPRGQQLNPEDAQLKRVVRRRGAPREAVRGPARHRQVKKKERKNTCEGGMGGRHAATTQGF